MTIKISHKNITYTIRKEKLIYTLSKLASKNIDESEILELMKKYNLFDEYFLKTINKI
ncbi:MAG: hypothetical protein IKU37_05895 [Candidatus Gastranaerophilales bacterium]|nr:hypothetical protein [Candidatus Gastranaerophilales bacterium]